MNDFVFNRSLEILEELCKRGTQEEVNLNGNGESLLDPCLPERVAKVKKVVRDRPVALSTNGIALTTKLARDLNLAGINRVDLSPHSPAHVRKAVIMLVDEGIMGVVNAGPMINSHNWAGQLPQKDQVKVVQPIPCFPLKRGAGYIQKEGTISPCCYDYKNLGCFGTVFEKNILEKPILPYSLCETCHQRILPETIRRINESPDNNEHRIEQRL